MAVVAMEHFVELISAAAGPGTGCVVGHVELTYAQREKARQKATLADGEQIAINIRRGQILRGGDYLQAPSGRMVQVQAAEECVSTVRAADRIAYHLGNRHVWLQVGEGWLRYLHDHVLDDMVRELGGDVAVEHAPFEPEAGAYGGAGHHHH